MPTPSKPVLRIGLTGGIAAGKSTVAERLRELGACVLDADEAAHRALDPGRPAHAAVVARFGREILTPKGEIDRTRLGQAVFGDREGLRALDAIVHPEVRAELARRTAECAARGHWLVVYDAALLVETGFHRELDGLIVVACSEETQLARLAERGLTPAAARARLAAQAPLEDKLDAADWVLDTEGPVEETLRATVNLVDELREVYRQRHGQGPG